jgi:transposase
MHTKINEQSFAGQTFYIGIDCHKRSWKVTILGEEYEHKTFSQDSDPKLLVRYLQRHFPGGTYKAVYEAGFSGFEACRQLNELGTSCMVIHAGDVPTNQKEKAQKTDKSDSRKLAKCLREKNFTGIDIPSHKTEADRVLVRQRFRVVKDLSRIKNRVKSLLFQLGIVIPEHFSDSQTRSWTKSYTDWLKNLSLVEENSREALDSLIRLAEQFKQELLLVNNAIRKMSTEEYYKKDHELLLSIPGIGVTSSMIILTQLDNIKRFKTLDELCNYVGLVPSMHGSGDKMRTGKLVRRGRKELKITLIEASWEAVRKDPALMAKFNELHKKMHKNKAIIRIARKMLSRIRHVLVHQEKYELGILK